MNDEGGVTLTLMNPEKSYARDREVGDKMDGYRMGFKINRGRRWKKWNLPAAVLRLDRRGNK